MFLSFALFFCTKLSRKQVDVEAATEKKIQEKKAASKVGWVWVMCHSLMSHQFCTTKVLVRFNKYIWNIYGRFECLIKKDCTPKVDFCSCASSFLGLMTQMQFCRSACSEAEAKAKPKAKEEKKPKVEIKDRNPLNCFWKASGY